ncbi:hypothetical protein Msp_0952 [Methanosphaera stadtmanae DSM 3091]|uniref:Uncharacterized protein n=1 Tax=Methanosphaera stadtmanae (strain ATCC 43021 / DSM 3091 / JCM 11832 / MCB-3) TaxID=339860 RepID=Q2NFR3_METST|nr:hypothetical protein Msp_0952 [Methanosphaera stadtmanae DSM 3091]
MILFYYKYSCSISFCFASFQFHYDLILLITYKHESRPSVEFQFHYDLILFLFPPKMFFTSLYFNFIMILFYSNSSSLITRGLKPFQFHYDLILLGKDKVEPSSKLEFQFHYDLILFNFTSNYSS